MKKINSKYMLTHDPKDWAPEWVQTLAILWSKLMEAVQNDKQKEGENAKDGKSTKH